MRISDWSSDVCSSDLADDVLPLVEVREPPDVQPEVAEHLNVEAFFVIVDRHLIDRVDVERRDDGLGPDVAEQRDRSEERREGKEGDSTGRSRWSALHEKKKSD